MADVETGARRVGKHFQAVIFFLLLIKNGPEGLLFLPDPLPLRLDFRKVVVHFVSLTAGRFSIILEKCRRDNGGAGFFYLRTASQIFEPKALRSV